MTKEQIDQRRAACKFIEDAIAASKARLADFERRCQSATTYEDIERLATEAETGIKPADEANPGPPIRIVWSRE